jgi:hypothetical protein
VVVDQPARIPLNLPLKVKPKRSRCSPLGGLSSLFPSRARAVENGDCFFGGHSTLDSRKK